MKPATPKTVGKTLGLVLGAGLLALTGCMRGGTSSSPPLHIVLDMDFQPKVKAQSASPLDSHTDGRGMRLPVAGTVARGSLPNPAPASALTGTVTTLPPTPDGCSVPTTTDVSRPSSSATTSSALAVDGSATTGRSSTATASPSSESSNVNAPTTTSAPAATTRSNVVRKANSVRCRRRRTRAVTASPRTTGGTGSRRAPAR